MKTDAKRKLPQAEDGFGVSMKSKKTCLALSTSGIKQKLGVRGKVVGVEGTGESRRIAWRMDESKQTGDAA